MPDTINGRTPEEIKLGLVHCLTAREYRNCLVCPYGTPRKRGVLPCDCEVRQDILALIDQLLKDKKQLERERDAAVEDIFRMCSNCKHEKLGYGVGPCPSIEEYLTNDCSNWQWRGVPQEVE